MIQPVIIGRAVQLSPPATMVAALIGVSAGGVVGALFAVPILGASKAIYLALRDGAGTARGHAVRRRRARRRTPGASIGVTRVEDRVVLELETARHEEVRERVRAAP